MGKLTPTLITGVRNAQERKEKNKLEKLDWSNATGFGVSLSVLRGENRSKKYFSPATRLITPSRVSATAFEPENDTRTLFNVVSLFLQWLEWKFSGETDDVAIPPSEKFPGHLSAQFNEFGLAASNDSQFHGDEVRAACTFQTTR